MDDRTLVKVAAIIAIAAIEVTNLLTAKIDSTLTSIIVAAIAGLAGYQVGKRK
jgi:hypothetical protein